MNRRRSNFRTYLTLLLVGALVMGLALTWRPLLAQRYLARARTFVFQREYNGALEQLWRASRLRPEHAETHFQLARVFRHLGESENVNSHLELARKHGWDAEQLERERWLLWAQQGRMREAEPYLAKLLAGNPDDQREACEAYVRGCLANLRLVEAQHLLTAWTRDFPTDQESWLLQGSIHEMQSNFAEAADAFRRAVDLAPGRVDIKLRLAGMLAELRQTDETHRLLVECLAAQPDDPAVLLAWSRSLQSQGQLAEAEQSLRKLLKIAPRNVEAQILLGEIALADQKFDDAIELLSDASAQRPHDTAARYNLARALSARGRAAEARPHLDFVAEAQGPIGRLDNMVLKAVENPRDAALRFEIGSILWKYGSPDDAVRWMRSVLELDPSHRGAHRVLAEHYAARGQSELASRHMRASNP